MPSNKGKKNNLPNKSSSDFLYRQEIKQIIKSELDSAADRAKRFAIICWELMTIAVLHDKLDFPLDTIKEYLRYMDLYADYITDDALNLQELYQQLKDNGAMTMDIKDLLDIDPTLANHLDPELYEE